MQLDEEALLTCHIEAGTPACPQTAAAPLAEGPFL